jgi:hypothetical protein
MQGKKWRNRVSVGSGAPSPYKGHKPGQRPERIAETRKKTVITAMNANP